MDSQTGRQSAIERGNRPVEYTWSRVSMCTAINPTAWNATPTAKPMSTTVAPFRVRLSHTVTLVALIEVCSRTFVEVEASILSETTPNYICFADGCFRHNCYYDWRCHEPNDSVPIAGCWTKFSFGGTLDIVLMRIEWIEDMEDALTFKVYVDGKYHSDINTFAGTAVYHLYTDNTSEVKIYADCNDISSGLWEFINEVRADGSSTRCTLGREAVESQTLRNLTSGVIVPRTLLTPPKCRS